MRLSELGRTATDISRVGLGAWAIGGPYEHGWGQVDDEDSIEAILRAVSRGVSWIDTAPAYGRGHSEDVIGRALRELPTNERPLIFTKCGRNWWDRPGENLVSDLRPSSIRFECDASLKRLGVDRLDLYQVHRPDNRTGTPLVESWLAMNELVDEGKVRWLGLSNVTVAELESCHAVRAVDSVQTRLNVLERESRELIERSRQLGVGVLAYSPMASGLLSGRFDSDRITRLEKGDWRRASPKFAQPQLSETLAAVEALKAIAEDIGHTLPELVIGWVLSNPGVTGAIVGARLATQVEDWVFAADWAPGPDVMKRVDSAMGESRPAS